MEPLHKERTSEHCGAEGRSSASGEVINDTAALHAADVGISVDSAVDAAKQSAIVLLDKSLTVIADGVLCLVRVELSTSNARWRLQPLNDRKPSGNPKALVEEAG